MTDVYLDLIDDLEEKLDFEKIYQGYCKQMLLVAELVLQDPHDAEDAVQEALVRIARNINALKDLEKWAVRAYVLTAAKNAALLHLRQRRKWDRAVKALEAEPGVEETVFGYVMNSLDYQLLLRTIRKMDPQYRNVMMLVYVQKLTLREAADSLGLKEGTVRKQLYRGRKQLIDLCKKEGLNYGQD